jgi:hypothetical protein
MADPAILKVHVHRYNAVTHAKSLLFLHDPFRK